MKTIVTIQGTHCLSCKALIEDVCKGNKDVASCNVNFETGETVIEHTDALDVEALKKEIESLGNYTVEIPAQYTCPECGFHYAEKEWVLKCEAWCKEHHSCNLEIIEHALK